MDAARVRLRAESETTFAFEYQADVTAPRPSCVAIGVPESQAAFRCFVPLRSCSQLATLKLGDGDRLVLGLDAPEGPECQGTTARQVSLRRQTDEELALDALLREKRRGRFARLKLDPPAASWFVSEASKALPKAPDKRETRGNKLSRFADYAAWLADRDCPDTAIPSPCAAEASQRAFKEILGQKQRQEDRAAAPQRPPLERRPVGTMTAGVLAGHGAEFGNHTGVLELGEGGDFFFFDSVPYDLSSSRLAVCSGTLAAVAATSVECGRCARTLAFEPSGDAVRVRLIGDGWATPCTESGHFEDEDEISRRPFVFELRRVDALRLAVEPYADSAERSDLGSAGGNIFGVVLGDFPEVTVDTMARLLSPKLAALGISSEKIGLRDADELLGLAQLRLMQACGGVLPGASYERMTRDALKREGDDAPAPPPPEPCPEAVVDEAVTAAAQQWGERYGLKP